MADIKTLTKCEDIAKTLLRLFGQELWLKGFPVPLCAELENRLKDAITDYFNEILKRS